MARTGSKRRSSDGRANSPSPLERDFVIPSDYTESRKVQETILADVTRFHFNPESAFAIKLALEEALINAIKHGNGMDPHKKITIRARLSPRRAQIEIEDEGTGFDRNVVADPRLRENLEKCCGRGIFLIESYMDKVTWTRGGRRLKMVRRNGAAKPAVLG